VRRRQRGRPLLAGVVWALLGRGVDSGAMIFSVLARSSGRCRKMVDQAEIHRKARSDEVEERKDVVSLLRDNFADLPDKEEAWEDLHRLTGDDDDDVRWGAVEALGSVFQHIPDKEQAQKDLHQRTGDEYSGVRRGATYSLGTVFPYAPDKEQAQKDLHQRTSKDEDDADVRWFAARALGSAFQHVPDKKQAWEDLIWLTEDEDKYVRLGVADALGSAFQHALDKEEAWNDLHRLTGSEDVYVRLGAADALAGVLEYIDTWFHSHRNEALPTKTVHILETKKEIVRIAVAQFCFELTESFPFTVKNRDEVKTKIFSALEIAKHDGANIVCLPELCLCEEWISEIEERYPDMIIIGGSFYKDKMNICPIIMESATDIPYQPKITPSPFDDGMMGPRMIPGDRIYRYETRFGKFVILICMDFDDLAHFFREADIDMIFCPSFNSANERFQNEAQSHVERTPSYILIANTGLHGGTSIFGQLNNNYFGELVDHGCKERGDPTYKLCEVKKGQEEVIIADFNLDHKGAQVPTPSNPNKVLKSVDHINKIPIQPDRSRI
jgi:HEAT repeat protein/predicted amidohydrolase